jgi:hypothetical protein
MSRMPLARHLRRSRTPGTTWWPAAKHAGVAAAPPASTSGEIDAWTGGVAPDDGVAPDSAFLSGVRASNWSRCCLLAGPCFLAGSMILLIWPPIGSSLRLLGHCSVLVLDSWSGGGLPPATRLLVSCRGRIGPEAGVLGVDGHLDLDPEAEERRKRKHPVRAAEASPELRSDRGLRRRCALPRFLGLGAVAGEGVGEGEALLVRDVEDGLGMAAAARGSRREDGMGSRGQRHRGLDRQDENG